MHTAMMLTGSIALVVGVVSVIVSMFHCTEKSPNLLSLSGWHPRNWRPIWRMQEWYNPLGYRLHLIGFTLIIAGAMLRLVSYWI